MGIFHHHNEESKNAYEAFYEGGSEEKHKAKFSHEAVSGAAAFFAMHEYEKKQKAEGKEVDHAFVKEMVAGIAAAEVDKLAETKGLDYLDREKSKRHAREQAERMVDSKYG
ncbi:hypothetical protein WJX74_009046 [Apatococcus lobatus]|uniref:CipC protein n=1 Tax=Apatococcus lobatus TaxID=904363 RepID=A0AAW1RQC7_9CHLO